MNRVEDVLVASSYAPDAVGHELLGARCARKQEPTDVRDADAIGEEETVLSSSSRQAGFAAATARASLNERKSKLALPTYSLSGEGSRAG